MIARSPRNALTTGLADLPRWRTDMNHVPREALQPDDASLHLERGFQSAVPEPVLCTHCAGYCLRAFLGESEDCTSCSARPYSGESGSGTETDMGTEVINAPHEGPGGFSPGPLDAVVGPQTKGHGE